jgi:signal transduction histidine kinase
VRAGPAVSTGSVEHLLQGGWRVRHRVSSLDAARFVLVVGAYVGAAKVGLELSVAKGVITPVWAPAGIAIAALVLLGRRFWPAVTLGAFLANATSGAALGVAVVIAVGNTLEAVVAQELLVRARFRPSLERVRDVFALILLGAVVSPIVAATNGVTALWVADDLTNSYGSSWGLWWIGDAMGVLVVASLILVLATVPLRTLLRPPQRQLEAVVLLALLVGLSSFVFLGGYWRYPHLIFPLYIWATLRFAQVGAVTSSFVVATIAIVGAVNGHTPIGSDDTTRVVQVLEGLLAGITISVLILGAVLAERKNAEVQLAEAQEVAHIGSWSMELPSNDITWSDELYRLYDVELRGEITQTRLLLHIHPDDHAHTRGIVARALADRQPFAFGHRVLLADGRVRWMSVRGRVVVDSRGKPIRLVGTAQDITERKKVDDLREGILSTVSHELRTPLTAIVGFATTLRERTLDPAVSASLLDHLLEQAQKLHRLLSDLLDLDRLRHGFVRPTFERVDVAELVEQVVADRRGDDRAITLESQPVHAEIDAAKVERIVDNLLANAIRHTPAGTDIRVRVEPRDSGVLIAVDDRGPGVPVGERQSIFEAFRRGADATTTPGTGVGLSLVAQFTELHGGRVWVEEAPGGGASFRVFLPSVQPKS